MAATATANGPCRRSVTPANRSDPPSSEWRRLATGPPCAAICSTQEPDDLIYHDIVTIMITIGWYPLLQAARPQGGSHYASVQNDGRHGVGGSRSRCRAGDGGALFL